MKLRLGISTCPNDTFAFHAILERRIDLEGLEPEFALLDVQKLNEGLAAGRFDYAKASFHAALHLADRYGVLRAGSALGWGVGPLLLAARADAGPPGPDSRVLCPGVWTTATLLLRCLHPTVTHIEQRLFSDIMPALAKGDADYGVVIHEGRFVYRQAGLTMVEDLGATWEQMTGGPLPLGGILGRTDLPHDLHTVVNRLLVRSIDHARAHRDEVFGTMSRYAQELDPQVIWSHVELYVNDYTRDLGDAGQRALARLALEARQQGAIPPTSSTLSVIP
jgi:1,4-dihydroxy-6-naphthoate synthase